MLDTTYFHAHPNTVLVDAKTGKPLYRSSKKGGFCSDDLIDLLTTDLFKRIRARFPLAWPATLYVYNEYGEPTKNAEVTVEETLPDGTKVLYEAELTWDYFNLVLKPGTYTLTVRYKDKERVETIEMPNGEGYFEVFFSEEGLDE